MPLINTKTDKMFFAPPNFGPSFVGLVSCEKPLMTRVTNNLVVSPPKKVTDIQNCQAPKIFPPFFQQKEFFFHANGIFTAFFHARLPRDFNACGISRTSLRCTTAWTRGSPKSCVDSTKLEKSGMRFWHCFCAFVLHVFNEAWLYIYIYIYIYVFSIFQWNLWALPDVYVYVYIFYKSSSLHCFDGFATVYLRECVHS